MDLLKKIMIGNDARSNQGLFSRGKPIYRQASYSAKSGPTGRQENPTAPSREALDRRVKKHYT